MIVDILKGTLRDMSRPRRSAIRIATKKASSAVIKKVTKPAKAARIPKLYILGNLIRTSRISDNRNRRFYGATLP
jgi:hypothetical protein